MCIHMQLLDPFDGHSAEVRLLQRGLTTTAQGMSVAIRMIASLDRPPPPPPPPAPPAWLAVPAAATPLAPDGHHNAESALSAGRPNPCTRIKSTDALARSAKCQKQTGIH